MFNCGSCNSRLINTDLGRGLQADLTVRLPCLTMDCWVKVYFRFISVQLRDSGRIVFIVFVKLIFLEECFLSKRSLKTCTSK